MKWGSFIGSVPRARPGFAGQVTMTRHGAAKIMVVDDEWAIRGLIVAVLEDEGYRAVGVSSGTRALRLLPIERPDLVLIDIMMPEMDGRDTVRHMRADRRLASIPIVMMSAAYTAGQVPADIRAFLAKPFDLDLLLETVGAALLDEA